MAIISSPKMKILKELEKGNFHGYELSRRLNKPLSSMYEHLGELLQAGLINYKLEGRRKVYYLTEKGKMLLKAIGTVLI